MVGRTSTRLCCSLVSILLFLGVSAFIIAIAGSAKASPSVPDRTNSSTADHSKFKELQKVFDSGPEVTQACLSCHTEAASQLRHTFHWTWVPDEPGDTCLGKARYLNNL